MSFIERDARLFVAGNYPERGIKITESDLDGIISHFGDPVPIHVGHGETPLNGMGHVIKLWRKGPELWGLVKFLNEAWLLIEKMEAKRLSCGFDWRQRLLRHVAIVSNPAIRTAQVFSTEGLTACNEDVTISGDSVTVECDPVFVKGGVSGLELSDEMKALLNREREEGVKAGEEKAKAEFSSTDSEAVSRVRQLEREKSEKDTELYMAGLKLEGKLTPAAEKYARAILVDGGALVMFSDNTTMTATEAFKQFMTMQPAVVHVPGTRLENDDGLSEVEKAVFDALELTDEQQKEAAKL